MRSKRFTDPSFPSLTVTISAEKDLARESNLAVDARSLARPIKVSALVHW